MTFNYTRIFTVKTERKIKTKNKKREGYLQHRFISSISKTHYIYIKKHEKLVKFMNR